MSGVLNGSFNDPRIYDRRRGNHVPVEWHVHPDPESWRR